MLKISEFSKLAQVPTKTLRYYDEIGLLKPARIDPWTGYRFYTVEQLPRLNRILALKALGLSLDQIKAMLDEHLTAEQIRGMLRLKRAETLQRLEEDQTRLSFVEAKLRQIEMEGTMSEYEVILKAVEPIEVAGVRDFAPDQAHISETFGRMYGMVMAEVTRQHAAFAGPSIALYHDEGFPETHIDIETTQPIRGTFHEANGVKGYTLPAANLACTIHRGSFQNLGSAYEAIMKWIESGGYHIVGPSREVYLQFDPNADPNTWVTEIQFPVEKG